MLERVSGTVPTDMAMCKVWGEGGIREDGRQNTFYTKKRPVAGKTGLVCALVWLSPVPDHGNLFCLLIFY